ncbi:hypothetical protein LY76DRAFT_598303 [Colletotrichum caudatum]|nr:hypothetical protein LY76DRAFT_598303 [Colletotrichum caudatum]
MAPTNYQSKAICIMCVLAYMRTQSRASAYDDTSNQRHKLCRPFGYVILQGATGPPTIASGGRDAPRAHYKVLCGSGPDGKTVSRGDMEGSARFQGYHNRAIQICHFSASSTWSRALVGAAALAAEQSVYQMYGCHPHLRMF